MTTTLFITMDEPVGALDADDPQAFTNDYVERCLRVHGITVHAVSQAPPWEDGLAVPRETVVALAEVTTLAGDWACTDRGCGESFHDAGSLALHMRSHTTAECPWCHRQFGLVGMKSHQKACPERPVEAKRVKAPTGSRRDQPAPSSKPLMPELGPIERRPFDPDDVRRRQASAW